ncbi:MAG: T9SS type A sorting domain-containing protein [Fluviicola sp.]|nr:T9SS type A sorting domain-containing protein [Fluviicola sp.]
MKNNAFVTLLFVAFTLTGLCQDNVIYGIKNKNYYTLVTDPNDPLNQFEQFDSTVSRLVSIDPVNGQLANIGSYTFTEGLNGTGGTIDPYNNFYLVSTAGGNSFKSIDLVNGNLVNNPAVALPNGITSFQEWRFNNSDTTVYGLAINQTEQYLSKINPVTGAVSLISQNPITPNGYGSGNTTIDPYFMVYYYTQPLNNHLVGLDLYDGTVYNDVPITISGNAEGKRFVNLVYNCRDTLIYGLVQETYTSLVPNPNDPNNPTEEVDSTTLKLARINSTTGIVTILSPTAISYGGFDVNGGVTIDPFNGIYYYSSGTAIIGISTVSGLVVSNEPFATQVNENVKLLRFYDNCKDVDPIREDPALTANLDIEEMMMLSIFPNPTNEHCTIQSNSPIKSVHVFDQAGRLINEHSIDSFENKIDISTTNLNNGLYMLVINNVKTIKLTIDHTSID